MCLAHLFTYYAFSDQRVGLAYIGETNNAGGVCATTSECVCVCVCVCVQLPVSVCVCVCVCV